VFLELMRLARDVGVSFAFPTQSLHIESMVPPAEKRLPPTRTVEQLGEIVDAYGPGGDRARPEGPQITTSQYVPGVPADRGSEDDG